jgi:DNA-binding NarL/FixJ family response regulator
MTASPQQLQPHGSVLICDDQQQLREALFDVLSKARFQVVGQAVDGATCLEQLPSVKPDVIILDVNMPGGGPELARDVRKQQPDAYILVFSAREDEETRRAMLDAGADAYLVKTGRLRPLLQLLYLACGTLPEPSASPAG